MERHITIAAILNIVLGAMGLIAAIIVFLIIAGAGLLSGEREASAITLIVAAFVSSFLLIVSLPGIIGGIGLLKFKNWARVLMLVISVIGLLNFPFGTAAGAYTIWVLIQEETVQIFENTGVNKGISDSRN